MTDNAIWFIAGSAAPYVAYVLWALGSKAVTEARRNFRPVLYGSEARQKEAVSVMLSRRFIRLRLPGHRAIYVRSNVPTYGDPGYRVLVALSDAVANEAAPDA